MPIVDALMAGVLVVPVKFNTSNHDPFVNVGTAAPLVIDKFGAFVAVPPAVLPKVNVLVTDTSVVNPPVPVQVNPVAVAIDIKVCPAVV